MFSLTFLSTSFRILGGRNLSTLFADDSLLANPVVGLMIGILVTVLVQSSTTSTSIIVSLVSAGAGVRPAIPMIFGSNIGTSVTNTIVSMTQAGEKETFRRAFAAATVHDMFNWLTVIVMMVLEVSTHALERFTLMLVESMNLNEEAGNNKASGSSSPDLLKPLTKPFTDLIVRVDKNVLVGWSVNDPKYENVTSMLKTDGGDNLMSLLGEHGLGLSDVFLGVVLLAFSLSLLIGCLLALMKILRSVLDCRMAAVIQRTINADIPYLPCLTGYIAMLIGAVVTVLVRSSSIFTSTLTPLCGAGLVSLETAYPMTLGSNIGTTSTAMLASLAAEPDRLQPSVQIALVHLFFNVIGILIFYPAPCMRWPIPLAQRLGDTTAEYRWFAALYLLSAFFLLPVAVFLLSLAGLTAMYSVLGAAAALFLFWGSVTLLQHRRPGWLPRRLRTWHFLPLWMRSLRPLDDLITSTSCAKSLLPIVKVEEAEDEETKNLTGGSGSKNGGGGGCPADSAKFLAAGCCSGGGATVSAGSSPDGITTKDLEIGAVCKLLEDSHHTHAHCHGQEEAALMQKLTSGDAPIIKGGGGSGDPLDANFVLRVVDDRV